MTAKKEFTASVALVLGFLLGVATVSLSSCAAPAFSEPSPKYTYLHFTAGDCMAAGREGQGVIDLRNGKVYCMPRDGGSPVSEGRLNLAAIPDN